MPKERLLEKVTSEIKSHQ